MAEVSIDDVAARAGVHRSTVSRAFSRPEAVNAATRKHVLEVAESLGYRVNPLAQALRRRASKLVPLIVPDITNPFYGELARTMAAAAADRGYQLVLCVTGGEVAQTNAYLTSLQEMYAPFGIVAPSTTVDLDELQNVALGSKVVVVDRVKQARVPTVTVDSAEGIALAVDHLHGLGHRRIAYVSGISGAYTSRDRLAAYEGLAAELDMPAMILDGGTGPDVGERAAERLVHMTREERPTAVIAANDMVAFALISALGVRGVSVPDEVSVMGFDGLEFGARFNPRLTTVRQPIADMGVIAIDLAEKLLKDGETGHVVLAPDLLIRESTAEVPR
ncbi:LacI family transcriptional repressor [Streptomyces himastatinicus ATCC 53653]|uniref:LacI family transcriptional repressor n=1 Tax=Streptomyces himastatinicus ATCC 53653 TaxID=457427 RepID=D9WGY3_9ACTN|nr:LacI family DNA-binding transcriptional regulator [Streptomyces himastatinicus]EFL27463.1 LacI family transcriptional repressor [Streptomyces himastatinicus ATCC 53653]